MSIFGIICGIVSGLAFTFMYIQLKGLRNKELSALAAPAIAVFCLPVFVVVWLGLHLQQQITYSVPYFGYTLLWASLSPLTLMAATYLLRFQSLTEFKSYRTTFMVLFTLLLDIFIFAEQFALSTLVAIGLTLWASWQLMRMRSAPSPTHFMPLLPKLGLLLLLTIAITAQLMFYKKALLLQPNPLAHFAVAYALTALLRIPFFLPKLLNALKQGGIRPLQLASLVGLMLLGQFTEVLAYKNLPITMVVLTSVLASILFAIADIKNKELSNTPRLWLAVVLMSSGIAMSYLYK